MVAASRSNVDNECQARLNRVKQLLEQVCDPEIPVVSIAELGILREVRCVKSGGATGLAHLSKVAGLRREVAAADLEVIVEVIVTPTYSGCPAIEQIRAEIVTVLSEAGIRCFTTIAWAPAWTSAWITAAGRLKLLTFGIAPPGPVIRDDAGVVPQVIPIRPTRAKASALDLHKPACPRCASLHTECLSQFGSSACKALYRCRDCREPFDYFKAY